MAAVAILILLAGMGVGWLVRNRLLRLLRDRHPGVFAELGYPSVRSLASVLPRHGEVQVRFWRYLWGGKVFRINDRGASVLASIALLADAGLVIGAALLLWSAAG